MTLDQEASSHNVAKDRDEILKAIAEIKESVVTLYNNEAEEEATSSQSSSTFINELDSNRFNQRQIDS